VIAPLLEQTFTNFNNLRVLILGDVMIDGYLWGKVERISPEAPVPIVSVTKIENRLGGAANVALNIAALGATPVICSVVGDDEKGKLFDFAFGRKQPQQHRNCKKHSPTNNG
jgi:D-glycero-beta-D-manno-heptose-7-phosphate kinase